MPPVSSTHRIFDMFSASSRRLVSGGYVRSTAFVIRREVTYNKSWCLHRRHYPDAKRTDNEAMKKIGQYCILLPIITVLAAAPLKTEGSSKKYKTDKAEQAGRKLPSSAPKRLTVLSDLDEDTILQILDFIDNQTGLACTFVPYDGAYDVAGNSFDVFVGSFFKPAPEMVHPYDSDVWEGTNNGIVSWSGWKSCLAFNTILFEDSGGDAGFTGAKMPVDLTGMISAIDPLKDMYTASALHTLYKKYGKAVLHCINGYIPLYMRTKRELTAALENGRYAGAFTIDGYVIPLLEAHYPLHIDYNVLDSDQFPVTTVMGTNIAFISADTQNLRGAQYFLDFLAREQFRQFVRRNFFFTPPYTESSEGAESNFLPLALEANWFQTFSAAWKEVVYPDGIDEKLLSQLH